MNESKNEAIALLRQILHELKQSRRATDKLANSNFGLSKDLRRWFGDRTRQPALSLDPTPVLEETTHVDDIGGCLVEGCEWRGTLSDLVAHDKEAHS